MPRVMNELPFMATENIHDGRGEAGRRPAAAARAACACIPRLRATWSRKKACTNDLLSRIAADPLFQTTEAELQSLLDPTLYTGRSAQQVDEFLSTFIRPLLAENAALLGEHETLTV